jgi:hypothetical protein
MANETQIKKSPLESLTVQQRERLTKLSSEISFCKLTVSFSIEDRDGNGRKKSAFYSVTASRGTGAEIPQMHEGAQSASFNSEDVKIVRNLLCKHVVRAVYEDAAKRGLMPNIDAAAEAQAILSSYDKTIVRLLQEEDAPKKTNGTSNGVSNGVANSHVVAGDA